MNIEVDARGQLCPKPVILTKKELDKIHSGIVTTIVDNETARDNVSKLANSQGYSFTVDKTKENEYYIRIEKGMVENKEEVEENNDQALVCEPNFFKDLTLAISSDKMGQGDEKLGHLLMKSFIYTVKETSPFPSTMVFYNSGVFLTSEGSEVLDDLKALEDEGVEIYSCGTCLDYYNLKDKLKVGQIGNMYDIYESMKSANNTITIS